MIRTHYGITVDSEVPVTGVLQLNGPSMQSVMDEVYGADSIDLGMEAHREECKGQCAACDCNHDGNYPGFAKGECYCARIGGSRITVEPHEYDPTDEHERCAPEGPNDTLIGSWKKVDGKWEPDPEGKDEYAAIVREFVVQVVWSKHTARAAMCSPCYPGQADLDTPKDDGQVAYTLPPDFFEA